VAEDAAPSRYHGVAEPSGIRATGRDPAAERRADRRREKEDQAKVREIASRRLTVRKLCEMNLDGRVIHMRKEKSAKEAGRTLERVFDDRPDFADLDAAAVTRAIAFDLLEDYARHPGTG
jgi:hypothetical protein